MSSKRKRTVSLVLGSGGARGYAHIGVIRQLVKQNYEIKSICGSSIGALIGGLYANGKLEDYETWILNLNIINILKLIDFSFSKEGIIDGEKVFSNIEEMIGDIKIEELPISFSALATDISNRKEVLINKGSLKDAIRASISVPTIFTPHELNGKKLFDGGILNPIPITYANKEECDLLIAVNLNDNSKIDEKYSYIFQEDNTLKEKIRKVFGDNESYEKDLSFFGVINQSLETMQELISKYQLEKNSPDIMINVSSELCDFYDFHKAKELIEYGEALTKDILNSAKKA